MSAFGEGFSKLPPADQAAILYRIMHEGEQDPTFGEGQEFNEQQMADQAAPPVLDEEVVLQPADRFHPGPTERQLFSQHLVQTQASVPQQGRLQDQCTPIPQPFKLMNAPLKARGAPQGRSLIVNNQTGPIASMRDKAWDRLGQENLATIDLGEAREHLRYLQETKPPARERPPRRLPVKTKMDELFDIVAMGKRDIKHVKEAQSAVGAANWIKKHRLGESLYVDARDYDGDGVPDIIVRKTSDHKPYIVKGYTTDDSTYPLRQAYYTTFPTSDDRKGHPIREYQEDTFVTHYTPDGLHRILDPDMVAYDKKIVAAGYKQSRPRPQLTAVAAFKRFIMQPIMKAIKGAYKAMNAPLEMKSTMPTQAEVGIRNNLIIGPIMKKIYGDEVLNVTDGHEWHKLTQRKQIRDAVAEFTGLFVLTRASVEDDLITAIVQALQLAGVKFPASPAWNAVLNEPNVGIKAQLHANKYWGDQRFHPAEVVA
jgi:hypothetical protein